MLIDVEKQKMLDQINDDEYNEELRLCGAAGGNENELKKLGFDVYQLSEIRKGLEAKIDVNKYYDPKIPWFVMEGIRLEIEDNIDLSFYRNEGFDWNQLAEIRMGLKDKLDVSFYDKKEYLPAQMKEIRLGLLSRVDVSLYSDIDYDWFQMEELRKGLENGIDISIYSNKDYSNAYMHQLRKAVEEGFDALEMIRKKYSAGTIYQIRKAASEGVEIHKYIEDGYNSEQLQEIRIAVRNNVDLDKYLSADFAPSSLREIRKGLEQGFDVSIYADMGYNWEQMREIRIGLEKRIDVSFYLKPLFLCGQMREIRIGLEKGLDVSGYANLMYSPTDMRRMREQLERNAESMKYKFEPVSEEAFEISCDNSEPNVKITENGMKAFLSIPALQGENEYTVKELLKILSDSGVKKGISVIAVRKMIEKKLYNREVLVAEGRLPVDGDNGYYEFFFNADTSKLPQQMPDGSVDFENINYFEQVTEGQKLAVYHKAKYGTDGFLVTGEKLESKIGIEKPFLIGKGFLLLADKMTYIANVGGKIELNGNKMTISKLLVVSENLTHESGHVEFDGSILVKGNIGMGACIKAGEDIVVEGQVVGANIKSGGNILLKKGAAGGGYGIIEAEGSVLGKSFESITVKTGNFFNTNYCINCDVTAKERISVYGKNGFIVGGITRSSTSICAHNIGNAAKTPTVLELGANERDIIKYNSIRKEISRAQGELKLLEESKENMQEKYTVRALRRMSLYSKTERAIRIKEKELDQLSKRCNEMVKEMVTEIDLTRDIKLVGSGTVYPGCIIGIEGIYMPVKNKLSNVTFKRIDKKISVYKN